ncbi:MAG: bifunctional ADP-dependent NAD(P)H-hydrate dehydratase/NAD(P)H-hydrate epimerase [Candidatus Cloacimonetes bacterium HGW-Cloacimonetes-3]|nr:MAG: bifunctional ADP-dependent NAD(P)H-hydrate dehydratase/NAD(P)H-hydrate epimerase [Candidatus Cloacimonetes bacterium HGW-Cloacimonetes-3]
MSSVLSSAQMKAIDKRTINEFGLPARILMENAGNACADYLMNNYPEIENGNVIILHGCGNNSGDGFVIARRLFLAGIYVRLVKVHDAPFTPESKANYQLCEKLGIPMTDYSKQTEISRWVELSLEVDILIDAVFGIGFHGELSEPIKQAFRFPKLVCDTRIAIDIPSGVNSDTGVCADSTFVATETLCIHTPKFGHILSNGIAYSGKLTIIDIGIPPTYTDDIPQYLIDETNVEYPDRFMQANKGSYGRVLVIGGSPGYSGSVVMASKAALRAGAGYCLLMSRPEMEAHYYHISPEIMFRPVPEDPTTGLPDKDKLRQALKEADSVLIGCGLGTDDYALSLLQTALQYCKCPLVVDADAISLIAKNESLQKYLKRSNIVLTPHLGEFSRLSGTPIIDIDNDTVGALKKYVRKTKAQILLKNYTTVFYNGFGLLFNTAGNDGLATGGSGDVLAGIIASFASQGLDLPLAAINASYLMGKTAEMLAEKREPASILPSDIIDNLFVK